MILSLHICPANAALQRERTFILVQKMQYVCPNQLANIFLDVTFPLD